MTPRKISAIQAQTIIEMKTRKLTIPIRALGTFRWSCCWSLWDSGSSIPSLLRPPCRNKAQRWDRFRAEGAQQPWPVAPSPAIAQLAVRLMRVLLPRNSPRTRLKSPRAAAADNRMRIPAAAGTIMPILPARGAGMKTNPACILSLAHRGDWFQAGIPGFPPRHPCGKSGRE